MAALPARRRRSSSSRKNLPLIDPSREFEDIYSRMGQLLNLAFWDTGMGLAGAPWAPAADVSETDDTYQVHVELPGPKTETAKPRRVEISG